MTNPAVEAVRLQAFYIDAATGQRFCVFHPAQGRPQGRVLYVHPFGEEMNKSRRMAALQSRALARAGFSVLQIDLCGCGDSSGEFGDARWAGWVDDVLLAHRWLDDRADGPLWLWGLRAGCLLAAGAAARIDEAPNFLFWQPASSGKSLLQQFLRLKAAAEMIGGNAKGVVENLRGQLSRGQSVDVAGYRLAPELAAGFDDAVLAPPHHDCNGHRVLWIEMSTRADASLSPASVATMQRWRVAGFAVEARVVAGPAFWQTIEIEEAPQLIESTLRALAAQTETASEIVR